MTRVVQPLSFFPHLFAVFDLFSGTDVEVKYRAEFEPQNPARARRTRRPDGCPPGLDRQTDRLLAQGDDLSRLNSKRDGGSAPIFPVEVPVVVGETHEPALLQVEREQETAAELDRASHFSFTSK